MTWFADLSECDYFGNACAKHLRAVGWLGDGKPFPTGSVDDRVLTKLSKLLKKPWQLVSFMGFHNCDFCPELDPDAKFWSGDFISYANLFVPGQGTIYVCPEGIRHYIRKHGYAPPAEFIRAVAECPPMSSRAYFDALKAQGGEPLIDGTCLKQSTDLVAAPED
jgi:hypothetical protein